MIGSDKVKKIFKSLIIVFTIIFLLCPMCFSSTKDEVKFKEQIKKEDGSLFEKIIALEELHKLYLTLQLVKI